MYAYNTKPFKKFFKDEPEPIITFDFAMPKGYENAPFNTQQLQDINHWLQTNAKTFFSFTGEVILERHGCRFEEKRQMPQVHQSQHGPQMSHCKFSKTLPVQPLSKY